MKTGMVYDSVGMFGRPVVLKLQEWLVNELIELSDSNIDFETDFCFCLRSFLLAVLTHHWKKDQIFLLYATTLFCALAIAVEQSLIRYGKYLFHNLSDVSQTNFDHYFSFEIVSYTFSDFIMPFPSAKLTTDPKSGTVTFAFREML